MAAWEFPRKVAAPGEVEFAFVPGLFARALPRIFAEARNSLHAEGLSNHLLAAGLADSADRAVRRIQALAARRPQARWIWLTHSKGGLHALTALAEDAHLRARTAGVVLVQCPAGSSKVLDSVLIGRHRETASRLTRVKERLQSGLLRTVGARTGCLEITESGLAALTRRATARLFDFPVLSVATWSVRPTSWLDSYHRRLSEIAPEVAHDGQFLLPDQLWPRYEQIFLPELDHAQPVLGGFGFDPGRFWLTLAELVVARLRNH